MDFGSVKFLVWGFNRARAIKVSPFRAPNAETPDKRDLQTSLRDKNLFGVLWTEFVESTVKNRFSPKSIYFRAFESVIVAK